MEQPEPIAYDFCRHCKGLVRKGFYHESDKYYHYYFCEVELKPNEKHRFAIKTKYTLKTERLKQDATLMIGAGTVTAGGALVIKKTDKNGEPTSSPETDNTNIIESNTSPNMAEIPLETGGLEIIQDTPPKSLLESFWGVLTEGGDGLV